MVEVLVHHPSNESFLNSAKKTDGKGHSVPGKAPEMADRKPERVDTTGGYSGHKTHSGEAPVNPKFGRPVGK